MIPDWVMRQLEARGLSDNDGVRRAATAGLCATCKARVLWGLDADRCAIPAVVDAQPVDQVGELLALAAGRSTYDLARTGGTWQLEHRRPPHVAAPRQHVVLAAHQCGAAPLPASTAPTPAPTATSSQTGDPAW